MVSGGAIAKPGGMRRLATTRSWLAFYDLPCRCLFYPRTKRGVLVDQVDTTQLDSTVPIQSWSKPYRGLWFSRIEIGRLQKLKIACTPRSEPPRTLTSNKTFFPSSSPFFTLCTVNTLCSHQSLSIKYQSIGGSYLLICNS